MRKAVEGLLLFSFNQWELCTCPSRALIQESIYDQFKVASMIVVKPPSSVSPARSARY